MDHVVELRGRLFWVAVAFIISAAAAYPFYEHLIHIIVAPLGKQELYYTTPAGGLSLIIKLCMYAGIVGMMPVFIYQFYKFISPVMSQKSARNIIGYTTASVILAAVGIAFAYFVSLPASLYFLTNIEVDQVSALLTLDAYLSFIAAYIIAGAFLFQLPLIMLIINSVTPLTPGRLMGYQRFLIIGAFIVAAIISPTPDAVNQTILAAPIVLMYQLGIIILWFKHRRLKRKQQRVVNNTIIHQAPKATKTAPSFNSISKTTGSALSVFASQKIKRPVTASSTQLQIHTPKSQAQLSNRPRFLDGVAPIKPTNTRQLLQKIPQTTVAVEQTTVNRPSVSTVVSSSSRRPVDGFYIPPRHTTATPQPLSLASRMPSLGRISNRTEQPLDIKPRLAQIQ